MTEKPLRKIGTQAELIKKILEKIINCMISGDQLKEEVKYYERLSQVIEKRCGKDN